MVEIDSSHYRVNAVKKGGMGIVYLCYDLRFKRLVALKSFQDSHLKDRAKVKRFIWEAETWIRLEKHPNIVQAYYVEMVENRPYICIEYVEGDERFGSDLVGWIRKGVLDLPGILDFAIQICSGMIHADKKFTDLGRIFIFRDIKPSNIMVTKERVVKITDFGLVKLAHEIDSDPTLDTPANLSADMDTMILSRPGTIAGTPPYMAPELWEGQSIDNGVDIYAFGCLLYEMITGLPPFSANNIDEMMDKHLLEVPKPLPFAPKSVNVIISKCLEKNRSKRYANFSEIKNDLTPIYEAVTGTKYVQLATGDNLDVWELVNKGISLLNLKYYNDALNCFNQAIESMPNFAEAYLNRAVLYRALNDFPHALADYVTAINLKPKDPDAYFNRGNTLRAMGRIEEALKDYRSALLLRPDYAGAYFNMGSLYRDVGNTAEALSNYDKAIELKPGASNYLYNRGCIYQQSNRLKDAMDDYKKAIDLNTDFTPAYYNYALCMELSGQIHQALELWEKYITAARDDPSQQKWIESVEQHIEELKTSLPSLSA
ncbi:MAG: tetratricopeptide repeat protein [Nitrospirae bacterium]|nr:tetratricopeptide repeat protein [Nitrospirota bacterium]